MESVSRFLINEKKKIFYLDVIQRKSRFCGLVDKKLRKMRKIAIFSGIFLLSNYIEIKVFVFFSFIRYLGTLFIF
jgi:hypothetical protein